MQPAVTSIQRLLKQKLNIYPSVLNMETDLRKDLNLADWEMLYLLNVVEQAWHVSIPPNDSDKIASIRHLIIAVKKQQKIRA